MISPNSSSKAASFARYAGSSARSSDRCQCQCATTSSSNESDGFAAEAVRGAETSVMPNLLPQTDYVIQRTTSLRKAQPVYGLSALLRNAGVYQPPQGNL